MKMFALCALYFGMGMWMVHMGLGWGDLNYWVIAAFVVSIGILERSVGKDRAGIN